jgi:hypothetical protein
MPFSIIFRSSNLSSCCLPTVTIVTSITPFNWLRTAFSNYFHSIEQVNLWLLDRFLVFTSLESLENSPTFLLLIAIFVQFPIEIGKFQQIGKVTTGGGMTPIIVILAATGLRNDARFILRRYAWNQAIHHSYLEVNRSWKTYSVQNDDRLLPVAAENLRHG